MYDITYIVNYFYICKKYKMKKIIFATSLSFLFASCARKTEDFIGVHDFYSMDRFLVRDSTEFINQLSHRKPLEIWVNKITPLKIDLYKSGEEIKGTMTSASYQKTYGFSVIDKYNENKNDLKNVHIVNDTLIAEYGNSRELKIAKSGSDYYLIVKMDSLHIKQQECNQFATTTINTVSYKSLIGASNEAEKIKESNECSAEKKATLLVDKAFMGQNKVYLKKILSIVPISK